MITKFVPFTCHVCGYVGPGNEFLMLNPADAPGGLKAQCAEAFLCVARQLGQDIEEARRFLAEFA